MKIDNIRNILENAHMIQSEETYYQFADLKYKPAIIQETSKLKNYTEKIGGNQKKPEKPDSIVFLKEITQ